MIIIYFRYTKRKDNTNQIKIQVTRTVRLRTQYRHLRLFDAFIELSQ